MLVSTINKRVTCLHNFKIRESLLPQSITRSTQLNNTKMSAMQTYRARDWQEA